jgi:hypothetical protein
VDEDLIVREEDDAPIDKLGGAVEERKEKGDGLKCGVFETGMVVQVPSSIKKMYRPGKAGVECDSV